LAKNVYQKYIPLHHHFLLLTIIGCEKKMNRQVYKKQTTRDTTSEMTLPKIELQLDSCNEAHENLKHVPGQLSRS
jgi:hypothetical protein